MERYTWCASTALAFDASSHWEAFQFNDHRGENQQIKVNIHNLMLQRDMYMHESKEAFTSLYGVKNILIPLKFVGSFSDQVAYLVRVVAVKYQAFSFVRNSLGSAHKESEFLHSHKVSLTQQLGGCTSSTLEERFYSHLKILWIRQNIFTILLCFPWCKSGRIKTSQMDKSFLCTCRSARPLYSPFLF